MTSTKWWDGLDPEIQAGLKQAMDEATEYANGLSGKLADEQRQLIVDSGETELVKPSADDVKAWREAMKPVWAQFEGDIGADLIEAAAACNK